jgi:hypothetical protein
MLWAEQWVSITSQVTPNQSPLQQAMGIASLGLGAYKGLGGNRT